MPGSTRTALGTHDAALAGGFALMLAWGYAPLVGGPSFYLAHHVGFFALALAFAFARPLRNAATSTSWISWTAAALCAVGSFYACIGKPSELPEPWLTPTAGALCGLGSAVLLARWFLAFCYSPVKVSVTRTLFAFMGCGALRVSLFLLRTTSPVALGIILALLPIASVTILGRLRLPTHKKAWASGVGGGTLQPSQEVPRFFASGNAAFLVFEIAVFGLAMGTTRSNFSYWSLSGTVGVVSQALQAFVPLVLYWWFSVRAHSDSKEPLVRTFIIFGAMGALALFVFGDLMQYALSALSLCASTLVLILMYIRMFDAVNRSGTHPFVVFGLVRGSLEIAIVVGSLVIGFVLRCNNMSLLPLNAATFVVGTMLILLVNSFSLRSTWEFLDKPRENDGNSLNARCHQLAQTYQLTETEACVMRYLCLGRSKKYIAAELSMSEDSVRYYAKQLYRKLDVHTREELMTLAGID